MILADVLSGLVETDTDLLLAINGWRAEWADYFMYAFSGKWIWVPLYAAILYVIVRNLHWKVAIGCVVAIALTIVFADQVGHAANTFGLAFFLFYLFRNRALNWFIMLWAVVTCYSRSYLGVHYPGDLLVGAFVGFVGASLCYWLFSRLCKYRRKESYEHIYVPIWVGGITISGILAYALIRAML